MDFNDTPEEAAFRAEARGWLEKNAEPLLPGELQEGAGATPDLKKLEAAKVWQAKKFDQGWACITWPKKFGGRGGTPMQSVVWGQEESKFRLPPNVYPVGISMTGPVLMKHGTQTQQERWLSDIARGQDIWCQLFSEPSSGSDLAALRTRAVREGDDWIINGQKIWTSGAQYARWGILLTRTDQDVPKHKGITFFVVDLQSPGIEVRPIRQVTGYSAFNEVFMTDLRIPDTNRISEVGNGWNVALSILANERGAIAAQGAGGGGVNIRNLIKLASDIEDERGRRIDDPAIRAKIADFYVRSRGLMYTSYRTQTAISRGEGPSPAGSIGKLVAAKMRQDMSSLGLDLQGAAGSVLDPDQSLQEGSWQLGYLGAPGVRLAGGTDEIMRNIIAERILGMPQEPRLDKNVAFRDIPTGVNN